MSLLEEVCASVMDRAVVDSLELTCAVWPNNFRLVQGFKDLRLGYGNGAYQDFTAAPMGLVLPDRNAGAGQKITFAIDNVTGEAQRAIDSAIAAGHDVILTFRRYVEGEYYGPAERPFTAVVRTGGITGYTVQFDAGFNNILDRKYPHDMYSLDYAPDLAYQ